jgi:hypothetical protein
VKVLASLLPALLVLGCASARSEAPAATEPAKVLPFIEDDYPAALTQARERKLPLFIDSWAPW